MQRASYPYNRRLVLGLVIGGAAGAAILGPRAMPLGAAIAFAAVSWAVYRTWAARREGRSVGAGLRHHWATTLQGARLAERRIDVHDGEQPLSIWVRTGAGGRDRGRVEGLHAAVATRIGERPVAFRVWPVGLDAPPIDPSGDAWSGPRIERAPRIEARLAGLLSVESSDEPFTDRMLDAESTAALLTIEREARGSFAGVTYDGIALGVHLMGPVVADPTRATQLARAVWRSFMP